MDRRTFWKSMQALLLIAALPWGVNTASAGPGGGTYYANSPAGGLSGTALRKFVDSLPGVGAAGCTVSATPGTGTCNENNLGQYIPLAAPDKATFPGSDYYVIGLKDYTKKMHSDLPKATKLRGYYQINGTDHTNQYLGPLILATEGRPVRVRFENHLGTGAAGNLFIPVDTTAMGAGMAPYHNNGTTCDPSLPGANCAKYTQNRATLHLHGGNTPWISDGTPHQWTTPVGETSVPAVMRKGVSTHDVPDMPASGDGAMTFYFTNQQSNRLMFYHDHAYGMTRLNVYAGEAAGYLLTDPTEEGLINSGVLPNLGGVYRYGVPLVIQDKTFVPANVAVQDAKWNTNTWGQPGDLWFPHVYEPNQDPNSPEGANPFGRWDYGPWFWPPVPVAPDKAALPDPSLVPEGFMDTPIVNGTAYPYLTVQPKAYRFRILNACNDRTLNLQLYYADPNDPTGKDVKMVPAGPNPDFPPTWPTDGRDGGVPDPALAGPKMIQIGTEGGFLPAPVVLDNTPIGYDYNRRNIVVLNILNKTLLLGAAERADVIVDFSSVPPGSNIILYNDAPAPTPAFDPRYDYFTGNPDQTPSGGAPSTMRGYGPNTRTIMQFRVAGGTPSAQFNLPALQSALPVAFKASQPAPIVPQSTYPAASGGNAPTDLYSKIQDFAFTYKPVGSTIPTTIQFKSKAIQELWDSYGRMNATLGVELPFTNNTIQTTVPMGYAEPATEFITDGQPQIWKITHNGVDTHPVHFHLFNVQVINRVGWDGAIRPPDDNEIGWKETVRMNPLEDAIVAFKPVAQTLPFALPTSSRLLDPTLPPGSPITTTDVSVTPPVLTTIPNAVLNYGFEYVWHCHILGHEENDFMRPIIFDVPTTRPTAPAGLLTYAGGTLISAGPPAVYNASVNSVILTWMDTGTTPSSFRVERAIVTGGGAGTVGPYTPLATLSFLSVVTPTYTDNSVAQNTRYKYRVVAFNTKGDSSAAVSATVTTKTWGRATGLTITASVPSPHIMGTLVNFKGVGTGATDTVANTTVTYQYRFWLTSGGTKTLVQDYGYGSSWALPETTPVGNYVITVDVRTSPTGNTNAAGGYDVSKTMAYSIVVPTSPPVTVPTPVPGVYSSSAPTGAPASPVTVNVTLTATTPYPPATIYYTTDGVTVPTTATLTKFTNSGTIPITATTTLQYFAVDANNVAEAVKIDSWTIHAPDLSVGSSVVINNGVASTNNIAVTLTLNATDPLGIATMQFSNDNTVWSAEEPFAATKAWALAAGADGPRTVYVKVRDKSLPAGTQYPLSATINLDTVAPVTTTSPIAGIYAAVPIPVTLSTNEPSTIYYTIDGTDPTTSATRQIYVAPIAVSATTTINYYAVDIAGNPEVFKSRTWIVNTSGIAASVMINGGAPVTKDQSVTLTLSATADNPGLTITQMQFSNDGITYSLAETFKPTKNYLLGAGDGTKTVYVKFLDNASGGSTPYPAANASIILDTLAPVTTASPTASVGYASVPLPVTLTTNEPATIYYTMDGTDPTDPLGTRQIHSTPISVAATTTIKYFGVDTAGNVESTRTGTWSINPLDLIASATINSGATFTNNRNATLTLNATDSTGVATMQFSNTGAPGSYSAEEPYTTTKAWNLDPGDGVKTVYVRFRDNDTPTSTLYDPVTAQITLDTVAPVSTIAPVPGTYAAAPINVTLSAEPGAGIYYTVNGTVPTTASTLYAGSFGISADTTVQYFAVDQAGNKEGVKSADYKISAENLTATVSINNGAAFTRNGFVTLNLDAVGIVAMQFSNDGVNFTVEEPYTTSRAWQLAPGDGIKTVYVKFRDGASGGGKLYGPFTAVITLDSIAPATVVSPVPGIYAAAAPLSVTLSTEPNAAVYYTINGTPPTTASTLYTGPIIVSANTTVMYFAVDRAGNQEAVKTADYVMHQSDMVASVMINSGASVTNNTAVTLNLDASDSAGVATMQFSNNGVNFTAEEPYLQSRSWTLDAGNGQKMVYVRFRDGAGILYGPFTASITMDTVAPVTTAGPIPGTYSAIPVSVTLAANEPATIYYTIDGSTPTTGSAVYAGPVSVADTTIIQYFAVDTAGNAETIKSGTWTVHSQDMVSSVLINNGITSANSTAVTLTLSASDPTGVTTMAFSNDGVSYTAEEPYATGKTWALAPGDGAKTVYVRFRDGSLPNGNLYDPVTASIILDTVVPVTTAGPIPGTYSTSAPLAVTLATNEPATIYYTIDGSLPTTASARYTVPIAVAATTTIRYFGVDTAGNTEALKSGTWTMHTADMTAGVTINGGAASTNSTAVTLVLNAIDQQGVAKMQFSNDGINYSLEENYATSRPWTLASGDGTKTVYVRFRDGSGGGGSLYDPVTASIILDTVTPVTTAVPIPGTYSSIPVLVTLTANEESDIYYTADGTVPTMSSTRYTVPISLDATTTIQYFSVDYAGNVETVKSGTWTIHRDDMVASVMINSGASVTNSTAVTLTLSAVDPAGVATMQFSSDGVNFTSEEPYATSKAWTLVSGNGTKTVYVRFRDKSLPTGNLYGPFTASITMDTAPPVTTASPIPGTYGTMPLLVTLSANKPVTIYYTTTGSTPTTSSAVYTGPISLSASTTIRYFAVDAAGNTETANSGTWTIQINDMVASMTINSRATVTVSRNVTLALSASDPQGVSTMQFSSDGITYSAEEPYATSKIWTLTGGDGIKSVYVRFRDGGGTLYDPVTASITLATASLADGKLTGNATVGIGDALRALQISVGLIAQSASDLIHGDVAPLVNGKPAPDGIIDGRDALVILRAVAGLVAL